jgi:hypothetical protein
MRTKILTACLVVDVSISCGGCRDRVAPGRQPVEETLRYESCGSYGWGTIVRV